MKKYLLIIGLVTSFISCGESEKELQIQEEKVAEEVEETAKDLFNSLEEDLKEEGE